jgi:hypothetical protein
VQYSSDGKTWTSFTDRTAYVTLNSAITVTTSIGSRGVYISWDSVVITGWAVLFTITCGGKSYTTKNFNYTLSDLSPSTSYDITLAYTVS